MQKRNKRRLRPWVRKSIEWTGVIAIAAVCAILFCYVFVLAAIQESIRIYPLTDAEIAEINSGK